MPTYEYRCKRCAQRLEVFAKVTDPPPPACPDCEGELKRVFHPVGVHFKGSGFYTTDYARKKAPAAKAEPAKGDHAKGEGEGQPAGGGPREAGSSDGQTDGRKDRAGSTGESGSSSSTTEKGASKRPRSGEGSG